MTTILVGRIRHLPRGGALTLVGLLLLGMLLGGFHHHPGNAGDDHCVVCTLAQTAAAAPPVVVASAAPVLEFEPAFVPQVFPPQTPVRHASPSRAPPVS